nr:peptidoglycan-binding protein [Marinococcus luteus]
MFQTQQADAASSLREGDSGSAVQELQKDLNEAGFHVTDNPTTYFGPQTDSAVKAFQKDQNLVVDGIAGPNTLSELEKVLNAKNSSSNDSSPSSGVMKEGVSGSNVQQLQKDLNEAGFHVVNAPTVHFGPKTDQAVRDFQKANGLYVDGVAGPNTLAKLAEVLNESSNDDSSSSDSGLLQDGVDSPAAQAMKEDLYTLGYLDISSPNGKFGPQTEAAVIAFQKDHGLTANGIADDKTLAKMKEALNADSDDSSSNDSSPSSDVMKEGVSGSNVQQLQKDLNEAGFHVTDNPTTYFGPKTDQAVRDFQKANGLYVDGVAGPNTLAKLAEVLNESSNDDSSDDSSSNDSSPSSDVMKEGVSGSNVQQLQKDLNEAGFHVTDNPTTYFGPKTEQAVRDFQEQYTLTIDGVAGPKTLAKLAEVLSDSSNDDSSNDDSSNDDSSNDDSSDDSSSNDSGLLKDGVDSPAAQAMKKDLYTLGYLDISNPNGKFGPQTEAAVKEFQRDHDLYVDGVAGPKTLAKISEVLSTKESDDESNDDSASDVGDPGNYGSISIMKVGTTHEAVAQLKLDLEALGFMSVSNPSNEFDSATDQAVKDFQRSENLAVDGVAGPNTMKALRAALNVDETYPSESAVDGKTIVLDAGHGGSDPGAVANGLREKDINLETAKYAASKLRAAGANVVMTRETDKYLTLSQRSSIGNNADADAFISIHTNAGGGNGLETYWYSKYEREESKELAEEIQAGMLRATSGRDRGEKQGNFHVIRETQVPSVLVELGFIDNSTEASYLKQSSYREKLAEGIYQGTNSYFSKN